MARAQSLFLRLLTAFLIVGLLALHIPLDAFREAPEGGQISACCASAKAPPSHDTRCDVASDHVPPPGPRDGCEDGCHCGCCGGLPMALEVGVSDLGDAPGMLAAHFVNDGARPARVDGIFHPPRA